MRDLLVELKKGKEKGVFQSQAEFRQYLHALQKQIPASKVNWDDGAGEDWAFLNTKNMSIMLHTKIHIAFLYVFGEKENTPPTLFEDLHIVPIQSMSVREWFFESANELNEKIPEIGWVVKDDAVNHRQFDIDDLYWATV